MNGHSRIDCSSRLFLTVPVHATNFCCLLQQECRSGRCCLSNGLVALEDTPCKQRDPCILPGVCNGVNGTCPIQEIAKHGTPCSRSPWGLGEAAPDSKYMTEEEAREGGYIKCGMCSFGTCVPPKHMQSRSLMASEDGVVAVSGAADVAAHDEDTGYDAEIQKHKNKGWT